MNYRDILFPRRCPVCDEVMELGTVGVCEACRSYLPYVREPVCMKCGKELDDPEEEYCSDCSEGNRSYSRGYPLFNYIEPIASSIQRFKYNSREEYAEFYGTEIAKRYGDVLKENGVEALVPVPIHKRRLIKRGYNQAELVAKAVSRRTDIPVRTDMIIRTENTKPQKNLDDLAREENLMKAFSPEIVKGDIPSCICIVDDIYTTGATIEACTKVFMALGVKRLYYISVAIGRV